MFLNKVSQGRKLPEQKVAEIAQGRVWSGVAAKEIGLVDEIGGLNSAIAYAANQAKLGQDWEVQEYPRTNSFGERFFGRATQEARTAFGIESAQLKKSNPLATEFQKLQQEIEILQKMNDPQGVYARLPFNLKIE
jgi:protease IV